MQQAKLAKARLPKRFTLRKPPPHPRRDELARTLVSQRELSEFVGEVRTGLNIPRSQLAARAGVSRHWLVSLESSRPTIEAGKVLRTLEALGFELSVTPYDPPPSWMLRAAADAHEKREVAATDARRRRAWAKLCRLAGGACRERDCFWGEGQPSADDEQAENGTTRRHDIDSAFAGFEGYIRSIYSQAFESPAGLSVVVDQRCPNARSAISRLEKPIF